MQYLEIFIPFCVVIAKFVNIENLWEIMTNLYYLAKAKAKAMELNGKLF